ncbi:MAG: hypothetical protein M3P16_01120 [Chloroflexota bacterium]|nr:hypothetical protein [Chloroflexota bacterium]
MLAHLEERSDVESAEVDRRGELLRITLRVGGDAAAIREQLELMGFAAEEASDAAGATVRWYGPASVGELSLEESTVIVSRVVPSFGAANGLGQAEIDAISTRVATAVYECFVGHRDAGLGPGGLASPCGRAVEGATRLLLGAERAAALGRAVEADLAGVASG